jgi:hypothetical protein
MNRTFSGNLETVNSGNNSSGVKLGKSLAKTIASLIKANRNSDEA